MSCLRNLRLFPVIFLLFLYPIGEVSAARAISIQVSGDTFVVDEPFEITASASGFSNGESVRIKGAFFLSGSTNYFGFSRLGDSSWVENIQSAVRQPEVVMGTWDNRLSVMGDAADSGYQGEGEYFLKLGYYYITGSGTLSPVQWSTNTVPVVLRDPEITPTRTPAPTATSAPTASPTHTPRPTATRTPTPVPVSRSVMPAKKKNVIASASSGILGTYAIATGGGAKRENNPVEPVKQRTPRSVFALLFVGIGTALSAFAIAMQKTSVWKNIRQHNS